MPSYTVFATALLLLSPTLVVANPPVKAYSCKGNENICQNICYYIGCAHPSTGTNTNPSLLTRLQEKFHKQEVADNRINCGATHTPPPFKSKADKGLGLPGHGPSPDEYPFASTHQGGAGAGLLGVPQKEQTDQGGKVTAFWTRKPLVKDGEQALLMLQDTDGIPYCDKKISPATPFCDGSKFQGLHYNKAKDQYCQWNIETTQAKCYDGKTGAEVKGSAKMARRSVETDDEGIPLGYYNMLHVAHPELSAAMWNDDVHGPMPDNYEPITSVEQWEAMNRTAIVMPPKVKRGMSLEAFTA